MLESNIFDIIDFVTQVSEFVLSVHFEKSALGREVRKSYLQNNKFIFKSYIQLAANSCSFLRKKIKFKNELLIHSREYENVNLFLSVLRLLQILSQINPSYLFQQFVTRIFELEQLLKTFDSKYKTSLHK